jgi:hypothetical protein
LVGDKSIDYEKESLSSGTTHSNSSLYSNSVYSVLHSRKKATAFYIFTAILLLTTIYFTLIFEYINRMLKDFNRSNVLNFQVTQEFINIDLGLLEATDVIIEMSQYIQLNRSNSPYATLPNMSYTHSKLPLGIEDFLQSKLAAAIRRYNSAIDSVHMNNLLYVDPHNLVHEMEIITEEMKYSYSSRQSGQKLIDTSIGGWTFYLYLDELILSQRASLMKFYNDASGVEPVELSAGKNDLTLTVLSDYLERMEKYFEDISNAFWLSLMLMST